MFLLQATMDLVWLDLLVYFDVKKNWVKELLSIRLGFKFCLDLIFQSVV